MTIYLILCAVYGIFLLILLFKVWRMTDNVAKIARDWTPGILSTQNYVAREIRKGKSAELSDWLFNRCFEELLAERNETSMADVTKIVQLYKGYYQMAGLNFPECLDIKSPAALRTLVEGR